MDHLSDMSCAIGAADFPEAKILTVPKGKYLFYDGDDFNDTAYLLLDGMVDVLIQAFDGAETMLYSLRGSNLLGELGFFGERVRTASVVTSSQCQMLRIESHDWHAAMASSHFPKKICKSIVQRYMHTHQVVRRLGQNKVLHRLGVYLLSLPEWEDSEHDWVDVKLPTHAKLASMLNCTRERVTRLIALLDQAGVLKKGQGQGDMRIHRQRLTAWLAE